MLYKCICNTLTVVLSTVYYFEEKEINHFSVVVVIDIP